MPGLDVDAAGQAFLVDAIHPDEYAIWRQSEDYGAVIDRIGIEGYGTVRANLTCRLESIDSEAATVVRTEPDLDLLLDEWDPGKVTSQPRLERTMRLEFRNDRIYLGVAEQRELRDRAWEAAEDGRWDEALAGLEALTVPDPMLPLWVEEVSRRQEEVEVEARLQIFLKELDDQLGDPALYDLGDPSAFEPAEAPAD
jgi:hypothetical protein